MKRWFLKGVLAGSVGTAVVLGAAAAFAATVGDPFKLGQSNTINATSSLYGSTAKDQLDVANTGTGSTARALGVLGRSTSAPAAAVANTNGGPALGMIVNAGKAPFTVNSATKVANLNADQLDGIDGGNVVQGTGLRDLANRFVLDTTFSPQTLLTLPNLGHFNATCTPTGAEIAWINDTSFFIDLWNDYNYPAASSTGYNASWTATSTPIQVVYAAQASQTGTTVGLGTGGQPGARRIALVHLFASQISLGAQCSFQAVATTWHT
jgi:hypothetical protein